MKTTTPITELAHRLEQLVRIRQAARTNPIYFREEVVSRPSLLRLLKTLDESEKMAN